MVPRGGECAEHRDSGSENAFASRRDPSEGMADFRTGLRKVLDEPGSSCSA